MTRIAWDIQEPGHFATDLVHHCGREASGEYLHTLQMIDRRATGWSERMAVLGRSYLVMQAAFRRGLARLPFAVLEIHPDNGSEFFNQHRVHTGRAEAVRQKRQAVLGRPTKPTQNASRKAYRDRPSCPRRPGSMHPDPAQPKHRLYQPTAVHRLLQRQRICDTLQVADRTLCVGQRCAAT